MSLVIDSFLLCFAVVEAAEQLTFVCLTSNLIMYLIDELQQPTTTAVGAFIADSYLGRFNTILVPSFIK